MKTSGELRLGAVETRFAELVWEHAPLPSGELVRLCREELEWAKSTTYTVLKKLCERGIFRNEDGMVSAVMTRDEFRSAQSRAFLAETFGGSLPAFLAAFTAGRRLTDEEAEEIRTMIEASAKGGES